ncbi:unnamed protein product [Camellia sinensis]
MEEEDEVGKEKGGDKESPKINNQTLEENLKQKMNNKAKSCKGCLLYSSTLNSNSRNPLCLGILRSLPQVPRHVVGESEVDASREGRSLAEFKYACVGYSVYSNGKDPTADVQETQAELPVCVGLEVLYDKKVNAADSVPAHVHSREVLVLHCISKALDIAGYNFRRLTSNARGFPQPRIQKPAYSVGDEFLSRFSRNASVVATGVAKNLHRVSNHMKRRLDDILYPYRSRPK